LKCKDTAILDQEWKICPERVIWNHFRQALYTLTVFIIQQTGNEINKKQNKEPAGKKEKKKLYKTKHRRDSRIFQYQLLWNAKSL